MSKMCRFKFTDMQLKWQEDPNTGIICEFEGAHTAKCIQIYVWYVCMYKSAYKHMFETIECLIVKGWAGGNNRGQDFAKRTWNWAHVCMHVFSVVQDRIYVHSNICTYVCK